MDIVLPENGVECIVIKISDVKRFFIQNCCQENSTFLILTLKTVFLSNLIFSSFFNSIQPNSLSVLRKGAFHFEEPDKSLVMRSQ